MERRGAASFEELPDDLELLATQDFDALQRLYAGGGTPLVPYSPEANAFFIRRLPPDQRGGRIRRSMPAEGSRGGAAPAATRPQTPLAATMGSAYAPLCSASVTGTQATPARRTTITSSNFPGGDRRPRRHRRLRHPRLHLDGCLWS